MTPSKVVLCVLGAVALLDVASAKGLMKSRVPKEVPVGRELAGIKRASAQVGELISRLGKARRLQEGNGQTAGQGPDLTTATTMATYIDQDGNPSCNMDVAQPAGPPMNIQPMIDAQCMPSQDDSTSTSWGFDGRGLILRNFTTSSNCQGPREVVTMPCGCVMGIVIAGSLCADVPAPAAHVTIDMEAPGKCISSPPPPLVLKMPIWEGCYLASAAISSATIAFVKNHSMPDTEVYAKVHSAFDSTGGASRLVYSIHDDTDCASAPYELFHLSCDCLSPEDNMMMDGFDSLIFHLTGEFCANAVQADFRVYEFMPSTVPCATPGWKASMWLGVCHPATCHWDPMFDSPCGDRSSMMAVQLGSDMDVRRLQQGGGSTTVSTTQGSDMGSNMGSQGQKWVRFFEYPGGDCNGPPAWEGALACGRCQEAQGDDHPQNISMMEASLSYVKMVGRFCSMGGAAGQCTRVARSMIPPEIEDKLTPCMSM